MARLRHSFCSFSASGARCAPCGKRRGQEGAPAPPRRCSSGMQRSSRWPMSSTAVCCSALRCSAAIFSFCAASSVSPVRWRRAATRSRPRRCVSRTRCWSGPSRRCSPSASPAAICSSAAIAWTGSQRATVSAPRLLKFARSCLPSAIPRPRSPTSVRTTCSPAAARRSS